MFVKKIILPQAIYYFLIAGASASVYFTLGKSSNY
jgi:hypothetical protein